MRHATVIGILAAASLSLATGLAAQNGKGASSAPALIIGASGNMTPIVGNLEEDARFYADLLGLASAPPIRRRSHKDVPYPEVLKNQGTPNATIRQVNLNIPGSPWKLEVLEFTDIDRTPAAARPQDPGAMTLVLMVRDIDGLLAKLTEGNHPVVTPGGKPVMLTTGRTKARAVVVKAPGGHFVELQQPDPLPLTPNLPAGNVIGGHIRVTVADTDATLRLYRDGLGFRPEVGAFTKEASRLALMGTAGAQYRVTSTTVPGVPDQLLEFIEFKGIDRKPLRTRIQDPGSAKIQFRPSDVAAAMSVFKAAGGTVTTTGGTFMIYMGVPTVIVRDMNNMFINMQQQPQPPATSTTR
jgi:catechol 2,3-dioxygenase-like lactoylglutathione lyase family enzyme